MMKKIHIIECHKGLHVRLSFGRKNGELIELATFYKRSRRLKRHN